MGAECGWCLQAVAADVAHEWNTAVVLYAEALEICHRLTDASILQMHFEHGERLPSLQLTVHDSAVAEYLKGHKIADRFRHGTTDK